MATKKSGDNWAQLAALQVTEASAGTAKYEKFAFPFSIMDKMALVINRIEYIFGLTQLNGGGDYVIMGLTVSNTISSLLTLSDPQIIDQTRVDRYDFGTPASAALRDSPSIRDFSTLPGGGILVAPNPLYGVIISAGASAAMSGWIRLYYTYLEMNTDEYWQLVEARRIISS